MVYQLKLVFNVKKLKILLIIAFGRSKPFDARRPSKIEFDSGLTMTSSPLTTIAPTPIPNVQPQMVFSKGPFRVPQPKSISAYITTHKEMEISQNNIVQEDPNEVNYLSTDDPVDVDEAIENEQSGVNEPPSNVWITTENALSDEVNADNANDANDGNAWGNDANAENAWAEENNAENAVETNEENAENPWADNEWADNDQNPDQEYETAPADDVVWTQNNEEEDQNEVPETNVDDQGFETVNDNPEGAWGDNQNTNDPGFKTVNDGNLWETQIDEQAYDNVQDNNDHVEQTVENNQVQNADNWESNLEYVDAAETNEETEVTEQVEIVQDASENILENEQTAQEPLTIQTIQEEQTEPEPEQIEEPKTTSVAAYLQNLPDETRKRSSPMKRINTRRHQSLDLNLNLDGAASVSGLSDYSSNHYWHNYSFLKHKASFLYNNSRRTSEASSFVSGAQEIEDLYWDDEINPNLENDPNMMLTAFHRNATSALHNEFNFPERPCLTDRG